MIDIGANLAHESFAHDLPRLLENAWQAGLEAIVITGSSRESNLAAATLCAMAPDRLFSTAGVHPHHASDWSSADADQIRSLAKSPCVVSLGECGLDYCRLLSPAVDQRSAFVAQLELAIELGKPVFLHQRDAHDDFLAILREYRPHLKAACVHCFTDTRQAMAEYLSLGCSIGITGWVCDVKRGSGLRASIPELPLSALMVETDAPYLMPHNLPKALKPANSRRNEPSMLPWVIQALAEIYKLPAATVAEASTANARRFFQLPLPA